MTVLSAGRHVETPVTRELFGRSVRLLAGAPASPSTRADVLETGIKVIDVMCPLLRGGTAAIAGELRAGTTVVMEELVRRLSGGPGGVSLFVLTPWQPPSITEALRKEGYSDGTVGTIQTFYFRSEEGAWTPDRLADLTGVDVVIRLSADLARIGIYPTVDPLSSRSRLLEDRIADRDHVELAARIREALRPLLSDSPEEQAVGDQMILPRARKLLRFFAQPFYVAEPHTKRTGTTGRLAESLRVCREILDGRYDEIPEDAFYFTGGVDEVLARR